MTELEIEKELDRIYDLEDLGIDGKFEEWNAILADVDYENMEPTFLMGHVIITRGFAEKLPNRQPIADAFYRRFPEYKDNMAWWEYEG
jgi:hypothetical protein